MTHKILAPRRSARIVVIFPAPFGPTLVCAAATRGDLPGGAPVVVTVRRAGAHRRRCGRAARRSVAARQLAAAPASTAATAPRTISTVGANSQTFSGAVSRW